MLLRKRPRTTMKRNTTLSQVMPFDLNFAPDAPQNNGPHHNNHNPHAQPPSDLTHRYFAGFNRTDQIFSTTNHQMPHKLDFFELPEFLRFCYRCQRRLTSDSDIYMYRGDCAFCSRECRQLEINDDEEQEKLIAKKKEEEAADHEPSETEVTTTEGGSVTAL